MPKEIEIGVLEIFRRVPEILIQKREELNISQKQLAEKLGISQQQINRYEVGRYQTASLSRLIEIADTLFSWEDADDEP